MTRKIIVLESVNTRGTLQVNEVEVFLNSVKLDFQSPTAVDWNETNSLEIKIGKDTATSAVSSLPAVNQISDDNDNLLAEICIREFS